MRRIISVTTIAMTLLAQSFATAGEPWRADPKQVQKQMASQHEFNYDEAKVPQFTLPNPLGVDRTQTITSADQWPAMREATMNLFREHVYGHRPPLIYQYEFSVKQSRDRLFGMDATGREVDIKISVGDQSFGFPAHVFFPPTQAGKKSPAIVQINNREFPTFADACDKPDEFYPFAEIVKRGYVICMISTSSIDPDQADGFERGLRGFFARTSQDQTELQKQSFTGPTAWKALSAWGWGASRALDYLIACQEVDANRVALIGHSRGGKTALWAAAEDPRFAVVCSNNSGCGGAALSRRAYGETVARITKAFPHWFCDRFATYSGNESSLPIDQHQLIGLIAPRAVYVTSAAEDLWADPRGEYLALIEAAPVFQMLNQQTVMEREMPALNEPRIVGRTGYHIRPGAHGLTKYDWDRFLDFCDLQFDRALAQ